MQKILLDGRQLETADLKRLVSDPRIKVEVSASALKNISRSFSFVQKEMKDSVIYGVNTGFGPMASHILGKEQLLDLQLNLIRSHSAGAGEPIAPEFVLAAMVVRLNTLAKGYSGVSSDLVKRLELFVNKRIIPIVPEHGAVGTSGDLVQLAHIALAIIGEGEVFYEGKRQKTSLVLKKLRIPTYELKVKEGLSLINGTSMMSGISALLCEESKNILELATHTGALALEIVNGFDDSFSEKLSAVRPHRGQIAIAKRMREILSSSKLLRDREKFHKKFDLEDDVRVIPETVQEVYSLRCIPQVLGPVYDTLQNTMEHVQIEINSTTDNPVVDASDRLFLHGGNFHGDYIAASIDQLKMTIVKLTMLSERRANFFLNNNINKFFPPFLNLKKPGLTLALQGMQFVATSTTAQSQTLAFPQYVHSISTNADNQDIVSMGTDAALITSKVIENCYIVLAIELIVLCQAVDYLDIRNKLAKGNRELFDKVRKTLPKVTDDRSLSAEMAELITSLRK